MKLAGHGSKERSGRPTKEIRISKIEITVMTEQTNENKQNQENK